MKIQSSKFKCQNVIPNLFRDLVNLINIKDAETESDSVKRVQHDTHILQGFTLIELLVVIAVIATFLTVGLNSFATAQKKGRDTKRKSDMKDMHSAMEQYYSVCGSVYPSPDSNNFYGKDAGVICNSPSLAIMPTIPTDPRQITPYYCPASSCNENGYTVCATLESESNPFCVTNSQ